MSVSLDPPPLVSILVPVYNRAQMLKSALTAACAQTWPAIEVVVVDNASTDATFDVARDWAARDPRVRVFRNEANLGPVRNWARCLALARGTYGKLLWSDDDLAPDFVAAAMELLAGRADVGFVLTCVAFFGEVDRVIYRFGATGLYDSDVFVRSACLGGGPYSPGCALFRLDDLRKGLVEDLPNPFGLDFRGTGAGSDVLLFLYACRDYPQFGYIDRPLARFRVHPDAISRSRKRATDLCYAWAMLDFLDCNRPRWDDIRNRLLTRLAADPRFRKVVAGRSFTFDYGEAWRWWRSLAHYGVDLLRQRVAAWGGRKARR